MNSKPIPSNLHTILHPRVPAWSNRKQNAPCLLSRAWRSWLFDQGSLTARLSALAPGTFRVQVLAQHFARPSTLERQRLKLSHNQCVWVREVALYLGDNAVVYARTAVPLATLKGTGKQLLGLGQRSLGSYLFSQPGLKRQPLHVSHCGTNDLGLSWCRHSVFSLNGAELMVSEAFAQPLLSYIER